MHLVLKLVKSGKFSPVYRALSRNVKQWMHLVTTKAKYHGKTQQKRPRYIYLLRKKVKNVKTIEQPL